LVKCEAETIDRRAGADQVQAVMLAEMQKQTRLLQKIEANTRCGCKSAPIAPMVSLTVLRCFHH